MISHREAEALISARLDQPLDPIAERVLSAHLATCAQCRAFAQSSNALANGLRELPYLPASPAVRRKVMARVGEGRSPWTKLGGFLNTNPGPALSTFAVIAVLFLLGFFVLNRFVLDDGGGSNGRNNQLASQPTAAPTQPANFTLSGTTEDVATETPAPTEAPTDAPTQAPTVTPTEAPTQAPTEPPTEAPTVTEAPAVAPTDVPAPTATEEPPTEEPPTEAPAPTEAPTVAPTAAPPTEEPSPTEQTSSLRVADTSSTPEEIVDLTLPPSPGSSQATATPYEEPTATNTPEPTATETPEPTATLTPEPTATSTPEPTATNTPEPTATNTPEPTATNTPAPTATATTAPTETPEPTATATATLEPTATPSPTEEGPPPILPIDGGEVVQAPEDEETTPTATAEASTTAALEETAPTPAPTESVDEGNVPIQPIDATGPAGTEPDDAGGQEIEPGEEKVATSTPADDTTIESVSPETPEATTEKVTEEAPGEPTAEPTATESAVDDGTLDLESNSEVYGDIAGDPSGRLLLDGGRMEYGPQAHPAFTISPSGLEAQTVPTENGQAVAICASGGDCTALSSASTDGAPVDEPLGWIDGGVVYVRTEGNSVSYRYLVPTESGTEVISDELLFDGGSDLAPMYPVYQAEGRIWVITSSGDWVTLTPGGGERLAGGGYGGQHDLRFAATGNRGLLVGYIANGQLIIAAGDRPGSPILALPFSGVDFDISPTGDQIVVSTGAGIEIYDLNGSLIASYASEGIQPGTVLWLNSGIVYHDSASGVLMQIPDPQL